jgi:hypothetical protein
MINLLPYSQKKMVKRIRGLRAASATIGALILLVIIGGILFLPSLLTINSRYSLAQNEIKSLENSGVVTSDADIAALQARTQLLLKQFTAVLPTAPTVYVALAREQAAAGISLTGFVVKDAPEPTLQVTGIAATREVLQKYIERIKAQETVSSVDDPIANYLKSKNSEFTITITFKQK